MYDHGAFADAILASIKYIYIKYNCNLYFIMYDTFPPHDMLVKLSIYTHARIIKNKTYLIKY